MALKNTAPITRTIKSTFNLVTQAGSSTLRNLPLGGAIGVVAGGIVLWFMPQLVPEGWSAEAVLSLGMGSGVVLHRLLDMTLGWFLEPIRRHLGAHWEAVIRLRKLAEYQKGGLVQPPDAALLSAQIVKDDLNTKGKSR